MTNGESRPSQTVVGKQQRCLAHLENQYITEAWTCKVFALTEQRVNEVHIRLARLRQPARVRMLLRDGTSSEARG